MQSLPRLPADSAARHSFQLALTYAAQGRYRAAAQLLEKSSRRLEAVPREQQLRIGDTRLPNMLGQPAFFLATLGEFAEQWRGEPRRSLSDPPGFVTRPLGLIIGLMGLGATCVIRW